MIELSTRPKPTAKPSVNTAIQKGLAKLEKWYTNIKESDTYFTCLGLLFESFSIQNLLTHI